MHEVIIVLADERLDGYGISISSPSFPGLVELASSVDDALARLDAIYDVYEKPRARALERFYWELPTQSPTGEEFLFRVPMRFVRGVLQPDPSLMDLVSRHVSEVLAGALDETWAQRPLRTGEFLEIIVRPTTKFGQIWAQLAPGQSAFVATDAPWMHVPERRQFAAGGIHLEVSEDGQLVSGDLTFLPGAANLTIEQVTDELKEIELQHLGRSEHIVARV